ncbi:MAG: MFS transporter [Nitrospiraceae bacterium]
MPLDFRPYTGGLSIGQIAIAEYNARVTRRDPNRLVVKGTLLAASMLVIFGGAIMAPTLPAIRSQFADFQKIEFWVRFVLTLPPLLIAFSAPAAGYIVDTTGRKVVLVTAIVMAGFAGISGYFLQTFPTILIGRAVLGIAVAGLMTSTTTLIADYYYGPERARFMGLQAGFMGLAGTLLLPLTGALADVGWRSPFLVHLLAFALLPFVLLFIFEPRPPERCLDKPPAQGEPGTCAGQSIQETKTSLPPAEQQATPVRLIAFIYGVILLVEIVFYVIPIYLPFYLQEAFGASAALSGMAISVMALSFAISSISYGRVARRLDHISVLILGFGLIGIGYSVVTVAAGSALMYVGLAVSGIGLGQLVPNLYVWLADEAPVQIRGRVIGGFTTALFLGQFLSPIVSQPIVSRFAPANTFLIAGLLLLVLVPFIFLGRNRLRLITAQPA